jgi:hypothetical protein
MVINSIIVDLGGIDDHFYLQVIVRFVDRGGIDYHYCLEVIAFSKTNNHL